MSFFNWREVFWGGGLFLEVSGHGRMPTAHIDRGPVPGNWIS
jgi:hypothetical protein